MKDFTAREVDHILKNPRISEERKMEFEKFLEYVESSANQRKQKFLDNKVLWKKTIQKEFEQKQHKAILAAHYLKLKDYYQDKNYDSFAKNLVKNSIRNFGINSIRNVKKDTGIPKTALIVPKTEEGLEIFDKHELEKEKERQENMKVDAVEAKKEEENEPILDEIDLMIPAEYKLLQEIEQKEAEEQQEGKNEEKKYQTSQEFYKDYVRKLSSKVIDRGYKTKQRSLVTNTELFEMYPHLLKNHNALKFKGVCISKKRPVKGRIPVKKFTKKWAWTFESELEKEKLKKIMKQSEDVSPFSNPRPVLVSSRSFLTTRMSSE